MPSVKQRESQQLSQWLLKMIKTLSLPLYTSSLFWQKYQVSFFHLSPLTLAYILEVKNQEAMVTSELLECLFTELKNVPPQNIENKYLQLLLILSSCGTYKNRKVKWSNTNILLFS